MDGRGLCACVGVGGVVLTYPKVGSPASKGPLAQIQGDGGEHIMRKNSQEKVAAKSHHLLIFRHISR